MTRESQRLLRVTRSGAPSHERVLHLSHINFPMTSLSLKSPHRSRIISLEWSTRSQVQRMESTCGLLCKVGVYGCPAAAVERRIGARVRTRAGKTRGEIVPERPHVREPFTHESFFSYDREPGCSCVGAVAGAEICCWTYVTNAARLLGGSLVQVAEAVL